MPDERSRCGGTHGPRGSLDIVTHSGETFPNLLPRPAQVLIVGGITDAMAQGIVRARASGIQIRGDDVSAPAHNHWLPGWGPRQLPLAGLCFPPETFDGVWIDSLVPLANAALIQALQHCSQ